MTFPENIKQESMTKYKEKMIVAADDFGISPKANKVILNLIKLGKIDRVAILIEGDFTKKEIKELLNSNIKIDIHLDFKINKSSQGKLKEGVIGRGIKFLGYYLLGKVKVEKIEKEWKKQIKKFKNAFGKNPDGINSHQYLHFFPAYFEIALKLAKNFNIPYIRFGKKKIIKGDNNVFKILNFLHKKSEESFLAFHLESSDFLVSLDWIKDMSKFVKNLPDGKTEIVCHPERKEEFEVIKKYL